MSVLTETAPKRIWLCVSDDLDDYNMPYPELYAEDAEITWSTDQPVAVTVEYVRVDLSEIAKLRAERDALRALLRELDETWIRSTCPQSIRDSIDAALVELGKERDYAMEMVNVQDNKIDALRHDIERHVAIAAEQATEIDALAELLREARVYVGQDCDTPYDRDLYDRIDAALGKEDV